MTGTAGGRGGPGTAPAPGGAGAGGTPLTGVDTHAHVLRVDAPLVAERHSRPSRDAGVAEYLGLLDAAGLSHGVLTAPSFYGTDNTLLLGALAAAPGRLRGTAAVAPGTGEAELAALRSAGCVGVRLNWSRRRTLPDPDSPAYQRLFATARDAGLHVEVLVEDEHLPRLSRAVLRAGAVLVVDHFGLAAGPGSAGARALLDALEGGSAWVKLSAPYRPPAAGRLGELTGLLLRTAPQRLLWGSDWPWISHEADVPGYAACLEWLRALLPRERDRHAVLVGNPARLLGL